MSVADDDWEDDAPDFIPTLGDGFGRLRPKVFRFQMPWNANQIPAQWTRAHKLITRAKSQGVEFIIVTFRQDAGSPPMIPSKAAYKAAVTATVKEFANEVDTWGPVNEPNNGWLKLAEGGPAQAAAYYQALSEVRAQWDPSALLTSADFLDSGSLTAYINAYVAAGGGWGNVAAWHPYADVNNKRSTATDTFASLVPNGWPIWITEVGARPANANESWYTQDEKVAYLLGTLANHPRITRISYYHMRNGNPAWDTALLNADSTPRAAWMRWCAASHGDNWNHPDCTEYEPGDGSPEVVAVDGQIHVFVKAAATGMLWHRHTTSSGWSPWRSLGDGWEISSDPTAISWGSGRIDVFARGLDNALIHRYYDGSQWSAWESLGGGWTFKGKPSVVSWGPGHLDVFARGLDGRLIHKYFSNGWSNWHIQGDWQMASDPVAFSWGPGRTDVFSRGLDNSLIRTYAQDCCGWQAWESLGNGWSLKGRPAPGSFWPGHLDVFGSGLDGALLHRWFDVGAWSPWDSFGVPPVS